MSWTEISVIVSVVVGLGGILATIVFVSKDKIRERTITSQGTLISTQGEMISTLGQEVEKLKDKDKEKTARISFLEEETQKLRGEINGKDLLIVTALKQHFAENPDAVKKLSKDFKEVLGLI